MRTASWWTVAAGTALFVAAVTRPCTIPTARLVPSGERALQSGSVPHEGSATDPAPAVQERGEGEAVRASLADRFPDAAERLRSSVPVDGGLVGVFPEAYSEGLILQYGDASISQRLVGGAASPRRHDDAGVAVYQGVLPGADAVMVQQGNRVEEFLRFDAGAACEVTYEVRVEGPGHRFAKDETLTVLDGAGMPVLRLDPLVYWRAGDVFQDERGRPADVTVTMAGLHAATLKVAVPAADRAAEILLDPSWSVTGSMITMTYGKGFATLADGRVLACGGHPYNGVPSRAAEIYSEGTGLWSATAPMKTARSGHSLTLLDDGRVLAAGGVSAKLSLYSCEMYDPAAARWSRAARFQRIRGRVGHFAARLSSGRVLAIGTSDSDDASYEPLCELYDPSMDRWESKAPPRRFESGGRAYYWENLVALSDGRALLTGSLLAYSIVNGVPTRIYSLHCEVYDPASDSWTATAPLPVPAGRRFDYALTLLADGRVLLSGGRMPSGITSECFLFYPATLAWAATGSMSVARASHSATALPGGRILAAGGMAARIGGGQTRTASCEIYDPATQGWISTASLNAAMGNHRAFRLASGRVLVAGGTSVAGGVIRELSTDCEIYTP